MSTTCTEGSSRRSAFGLALAAALAAATLAGCAKAPDKEAKAAAALLQEARAAGGESYAWESFSKAQDAMEQAQAELAAQDGKFPLLRDYDKAETLIATARREAEKAKADAATGRVQAGEETRLALEQAKVDLAAATSAVATAPAGKDSRADVEAMKGDLEGLRSALAEAESAFAAGDFIASRQKAEQVRAAAGAISADVARAVQKTRS